MTTALQNRNDIPSFELTLDNFRSLGLQESDLPAVMDVAARIQPSDPQTVAQFGREVADC